MTRLHTYAVDCDRCEGRGCAKCQFGKIWMRDYEPEGATRSGVLLALAILFALAALAFLLVSIHHARTRPLPPSIEAAFVVAVGDLDHEGWLPMTGAAAGLLNNAVQTLTGRPRALGCGGQAEVLYARLEGKVPGWSFELRYEVGPKSPILLPHQWVTAHGPRGEAVQLDPWMGEIR